MSGNPNPDTSGLIPAKPGEVRNPNGRAKGTMSLKTIIKHLWIDDEAEINGKRLPRAAKSFLKAIEKAEEGDITALKAICERYEGQPKQPLEHSGPDGNPMRMVQLIAPEKDVTATAEDQANKETV